MAIISMFSKDGLISSNWGDWALYTGSSLRVFVNELSHKAPHDFTADGSVENFQVAAVAIISMFFQMASRAATGAIGLSTLALRSGSSRMSSVSGLRVSSLLMADWRTSRWQQWPSSVCSSRWPQEQRCRGNWALYRRSAEGFRMGA